MNDGLTISFPADDTQEERRTKIANMAESVVQINLAEIDGGVDLSGSELRYEDPRMKKNQVIGSLREVLRRGRATCLEICAIVAAAESAAGNMAYVKIISVKYKKKAMPNRFHAVVRNQDGSVFDASELLDGYGASGEWWQRHGHCCGSCALDEKCESNCSCKAGG
jgi:hypothetical protein